LNFRTTPGRRRVDERLDITPLIDVIFQLLMFFLLTSNYVQENRPNIPIDVPRASTSEEQATVQNLVVSIDRQGSLFLERKRLGSLDELRQELERVRQQAPRTLILIRSDQDAPFGSSVEVMDLARQVGLTRFGIVTQKPE